MGDIVGDGSFRGIVMACDMCLGFGELITFSRPVRRAACPDCEGTGHVRVECAPEDVEDVLAGLRPRRRRRQLQQMLTEAGLCIACFGSGRIASIETDEDERPIAYVEAPCPVCSPDR